ncbi:MAG: KUP/HAK/KT family potassium transporter [Saprospiraceae bacterium]|nr:KUP/HAK/KT family potassium transporter [Saprospiraceae bacterium]
MPPPNDHHKLSLGGLLITLGIIFGDIGTSPLYVMQAITKGKVISPELVLGGVSCVLWTLIILTTIKYIYLALNADNKGEGGIFALYAKVRRYNSSWVIYPAIIGCATLIADGFITPPISISAAVEGLTIMFPGIRTVPIVIGIIIAIFTFQQAGTQAVGKAFGPIMLIWFSMLGTLGVIQIFGHTEVLAAFNPKYAIELLTHYPQGFWLLGAVFLCTTGAEALYSDLGHCGKQNIRVSWSFVLVCLLLNYFGQAAWLLDNLNGQKITSSTRIFYELMPGWFLPFGIAIATAATIIASQALISGVFTLVNEAMKLHLWFRMRVNYPSKFKGQVYIPSINWFLMFGCIAVQLIFQTAEAMEAAYGLAITIDMLMTTLLLSYFYKIKSHKTWLGLALLIFYLCFETTFLISNFDKLLHGGWFTLILTVVFAIVVFVHYNAQKIRNKHTRFVPLNDYVPVLKDVIADESISKESSHLVYLSMSESKNLIDSNIMYSILRKKPKRADVYWFVHVAIVDDPYSKSFHVDTIVPGQIFFVHLKFGFKVQHRVNSMFHEIVEQMVASGEVSIKSTYPSIRKHNIDSDFKFILLHTRVSADTELTGFEQWVVRTYRMLKKFSLPAVEDFGLEMSNVEEELVPILVGPKAEIHLHREM